MIYLIQNDQEYDYDVRATALAFFERTKIVEVTKEEFEKQGWEKDDLLLTLVYTKNCIQGTLENKEGKIISEEIICDYSDHKNSRNAVCRFLYRLFEKFTGRSLPWGMLTGIRPTKIIMKWMEEEKDAKKLEQRFRETYLADAQKANLCRRVAQKEKVLLESRPFEKEYSLYIGIPFCPTTCLYCSFTSFPVARFGDRMDAYLDALYKELAFVAEHHRDKKLTTIYIGGGTPTALNEKALSRLMYMIHELFPVEETEEFTVESGRPDSITREKFCILKEAGVTIKGCSHITGGGFYENIPRMLPDGIRAEVKKDSYEVPALFKLMAKKGNIDEHMMYNTFNMGVGMILAVDPADADKTIEAIKSAGEDAFVIGQTVAGEKGVTLC